MILKVDFDPTGIDEISVDSEKGIVTVIGDVDPVKVTDQIRKAGKIVDIISVGPPKKPEPKKEEKKKEEKKKEEKKCPEVIFPWSWAWPPCPPPCPPPRLPPCPPPCPPPCLPYC
ncbi:hypothetical protein RHSIM_Rhsim07G0216600 [Rhododendron simsii]|uniref:HMA domain-containing protein n=1 Tax=Rhododendron simsii TaxID=118357 RepID=A0A834GYH1_RHOSS|nr:hypothetical protein RHSIM_Rhsim07G0216600 [Rhododendron simsii]